MPETSNEPQQPVVASESSASQSAPSSQFDQSSVTPDYNVPADTAPPVGFAPAQSPVPPTGQAVEPLVQPDVQAGAAVVDSPPLVAWEASEYIQHTKGLGWIAAFLLFAIAILGLGIFVLKDWFVTIGFVIMLVAIGILAFRPPRVIRYELHPEGIIIGRKPYYYSQFQSFGVMQEGKMWSILLMPTARFQPPFTLYFEESQGEEIVDTLGQFLPMEDHKPDMIDRLASRIRF